VKLTAPPTAAELEVPVVIVMEPALPADELVAPVVMIIPPLEPPAFPVPEVNSKAPLTPLEPLAAVLITTLPLDFEVPAPDESDTAPPVPVVLDPAANDMSPPILLEPELVAAPAVAKNEPPSAPAVAALPAVRDTEPPSPLEPVAAPLVIEIAPPLPPVLAAAPVLKSTAPLLPQLVVPVENDKAPLTPFVPAFGLPTDIVPEEDALPTPERRSIAPPVRNELVPPVASIDAPVLEEPVRAPAIILMSPPSAVDAEVAAPAVMLIVPP
jgi:hypothetical protein